MDSELAHTMDTLKTASLEFLINYRTRYLKKKYDKQQGDEQNINILFAGNNRR